MDGGVDRHVNMAQFPNKLGQYTYTGMMYPYASQLLIYRWENCLTCNTGASAFDQVTIVGSLDIGEVKTFGGYTIKYHWNLWNYQVS